MNKKHEGTPAVLALASQYRSAVHAASAWGVDGEPEAQLTTPFTNLISGLAEAAGLGRLTLIRESRLDRTRPDFAVLHSSGTRTRQKGYIELKAPATTLDPAQWTGRNLRQWQDMAREAEVLILCNGRAMRLFHRGEPSGPEALLPYGELESWHEADAIRLLRDFIDLQPQPVTSVRDLSERLAVRTADLRDRLLWLLGQSSFGAEAAKGGLAAWREHVHPEASARDFADGISQVIAYGMVLAALQPSGGDRDGDGYITVAEARESIRSTSPVMAAAFAPLVDKQALSEAVAVELLALETLISAIHPARVNRSADQRGEPWLYFYEDFLSVYDPDERRQAGVYYTPLSVVRAMVAVVDFILVHEFGMRLGFADHRVVTLDPATGTGTFPLAVVDAATARAETVRGKAGREQAVSSLKHTLFAFELLPGPYAVAHLRLSQRLREDSTNQDVTAQVVLTDTLESPLNPVTQLPLFGDAEVLAAEQNRAKRIKLEQKVTVVIGNPPYRRVEQGIDGRGSGGWVLNGQVPGRRNAKSLFEDVLAIARRTTIFSHIASLYNLYVYFWRWALWKAFEAHGSGPGVVAFITASSWLRGPGFSGLRQLARQSCDEIYVLDLGGANLGTGLDENVFAIETPVAIVFLARRADWKAGSQAQVRYRAYRGFASDKLKALDALAASDNPLAGEWELVEGGPTAPFVPEKGDAKWRAFVKVVDVFPWQQPGCMHSRNWPVGPTKDLIAARWMTFVASDLLDRPALYVTPTSGRSIHTRVAGMRRLVDLREGDAPEELVRYGYRSFDRQWAFEDPRLAKTESPSLWQSQSKRQLFLVSLLSESITKGPALSVSAHVPDKHYFKGSYGGKDVMPLYRDSGCTQPNITGGLQNAIGQKLAIDPPTPEDLAAYVYALLTSPGYQGRFAEELEGKAGPRIPFTAEKQYWVRAVELGRYLLWLHTYAERLVDKGAGRASHIPLVPGIGWEKAVSHMPQSASEISYDPSKEEIHIGDGVLGGVSAAVWNFSVSGMQIVKKWLGYRTSQGAGRAANSDNPLDRIRPTQWADEWNDELLDLIRLLTLTYEKHPEQEALLDAILSGDLIQASALPTPKPVERKVPPLQKEGHSGRI